jgi:hypothetical protein
MALHGHDMDWETEMFAHMAGKVILSHTAKAYWKIKRTLSDLAVFHMGIQASLVAWVDIWVPSANTDPCHR